MSSRLTPSNHSRRVLRFAYGAAGSATPCTAASLQDLHYDAALFLGGRGTRDGAQGVGDPAAAADHPPKVVLRHRDLEHDVAVLLQLLDRHLVRGFDQCPNQVLDELSHFVPVASMPWVRRSFAAVRDGRAPCSSQCRARSSSITIVDGSVCGL